MAIINRLEDEIELLKGRVKVLEAVLLSLTDSEYVIDLAIHAKTEAKAKTKKSTSKK
jgi:hypothetical protein